MGSARTVHDAAYYLTDEFWADVGLTGLTARFAGPGAGPLGYTVPLTRENLAHALAGRTADGTAALVRPAAVGRQRCGTELLICAPPAVSALLAAVPKEQWYRVFEAHARARDRTLTDLLGRPFEARTGAGGGDRTPCLPVVAVLPNAVARRGTPLVHDHVIVLKPGHCPADGKARAVEADPVFRHQRQVRADYLLRLSNEVAGPLGLAVERTAAGFTVRGLPPAFLAELTPARREIAEYLRARGLAATPAARAVAAAATAPPKQRFDRDERAAVWAEVAARHGVRMSLAAQHRAVPEPGPVARELAAYQRVSESADRLAARRGYFDGPRLLLEATRAAVGSGLSPEDVRRAAARVLDRHPMFGFERLDRSLAAGPVYVRRAVLDELRRAEPGAKPDLSRPLTGPTAPARPGQRGPVAPRPPTDRGAAATRMRPAPAAVGPSGHRVEPPRPTDPAPERGRLAAAAEQVRRWYEKARPRTVVTVRADRPAADPRSLGRLLADARRTPLARCHAAAYRAVWGKWFADPVRMLAYAEAAFRAARKPKRPLGPRTTVVVERPERAAPRDLARLQRLAARAGATVVLGPGRPSPDPAVRPPERVPQPVPVR